uniref:Macaca fascicularis brain cDNA clone: QtrA-16802, similar to human smooth muscle myosin heavy chain 11 isoform SM1-like(LOC129285), mRNA, RefSeq: NM_152994.2 n=1 Tax=Macaca fascicularis TaxID=9541 RepID=I7GAY1_MACFA|nr:unnamed protein product [Macaca fascicularis]
MKICRRRSKRMNGCIYNFLKLMSSTSMWKQS